MKTRKDIYSREASQILRDITVYHNIKKEQLIRLYPNIKTDTMEKIIYHLQNNRRIYYDKNSAIIYDTANSVTDTETINCLWVLCDFSDKFEFHSKSDFPVNTVFFSEGEVYEVSYIAKDKEGIYAQAFDTAQTNGKRIIVLEEIEQMAEIQIPDVTAYCIVDDETGKVQYFKTE